MSNRLNHEASPYLLQHADNPVQWNPWDEKALAKARRSGKPILLSIGYSACHWCHVMAHESFEDEDTARLMNEHFVNIKVDREERPDLDKIYQLAHQVLTRRPGGWPLTMFLSPDDQMPFFGGTYFPNRPRHGMASFQDVLQRVNDWYQENRSSLPRQSQALGDFFRQTSQAGDATGEELNSAPIDRAMASLAQSFDEQCGGFGSAPKFPQPPVLEFLLHQLEHADAERMLDATLDSMAQGGLFDHLGGGFFRYCVDATWTIPHFEKMLYDNAQLLGLYAQASAIFDSESYRRTALTTARWVMTRMASPQGGFYSSLDADSEGEEGKYYVWTPDQARAALNDKEWPLFASALGLDGPPNFEGQAWHLQRRLTNEELRERFNLSSDEITTRLESASDKLLGIRRQRISPALDDKQLTSWNALMAQSLAQVGRLLDDIDCLEASSSALNFIRQNLWRKGRLLTSFKDGDARFKGYLDDYAFTLAACLELLQARWDTGTVHFACELADALLDHFQDADNGGFYFTADDHEALIQRPRPLADEATPSGNGVAAQALIQLGHLLAEPRYLYAAERTLQAAWHSMSRYPDAHPSLLVALQAHLQPPEQVIARGPADRLGPWRSALNENYRRDRAGFCIPNEARALPGHLQAYVAGDWVTAWICTGTRCSEPLTELDGFLKQIAPSQGER